MLKRAGVVVLGLAILAGPALAQDRDGRAGDMAGGRTTGAHRGPALGGADPALIQPPPAPEVMTTLARLDTVQGTRYVTLYGRFMDETRDERDSLRASASRRRDAGAGTLPGAGESADFQSLVKDLAQQRKAFNGALKDMLQADQWKAYQKWLENSRKQYAGDGSHQGARRRQGRGGGFGH